MKKAGQAGGVLHFGFRLTKAADIDAARAAVKKAGGTITDTGEFIPGEPYLFATDPDGYTIEIWYENPDADSTPSTQSKRTALVSAGRVQ